MNWLRVLQYIDEAIEDALRRRGLSSTGVPGSRVIGPLPPATISSHNHTTGAGDGGALSGAIVDSFVEFDEQSGNPSTPASNKGRMYAKDSGGQTLPYWISQSGDVIPLGGSGGVGAATIYTSAYASPPSAPAAGDLWLPSDSVYILRYTGSAWVPWGPIFPCTLPVNGDFAWVNDGGVATVDAAKGPIHLIAPAAANFNMRIRKKAAPSTPWTLEVAFRPHLYGANFHAAGVTFRQSSDGKAHGFNIVHDTVTLAGWSLASGKATSATVFSANYATQHLGYLPDTVFMRIQDNGTNRICSWSTNGQYWDVFHTVGRTDFLTADEIGFYAQSFNTTYAAAMTLLSWKQS